MKLSALLFPSSPFALLRASVVFDATSLLMWWSAVHFQSAIYDHFDNEALGRLGIPIGAAALCGTAAAAIAWRMASHKHQRIASFVAGIICMTSFMLGADALIGSRSFQIMEFS